MKITGARWRQLCLAPDAGRDGLRYRESVRSLDKGFGVGTGSYHQFQGWYMGPLEVIIFQPLLPSLYGIQIRWVLEETFRVTHMHPESLNIRCVSLALGLVFPWPWLPVK